MDSVVIIQDWDSDSFHRKLLEMERQGYAARRETYNIQAEIDPETGRIAHLHMIEVYKTSN